MCYVGIPYSFPELQGCLPDFNYGAFTSNGISAGGGGVITKNNKRTCVFVTISDNNSLVKLIWKNMHC